MLYMSYTSSRVFFMWVYECVFATLVECSLIEKSNEFFYSCKGGWSRPIHHVLLLDWYFVCLDWSSEWHVHRSKICSLTICLCIFPHSWRFFYLNYGLLLQQWRVCGPKPKVQHVCLSIRNTVIQQRMHNHGDHEEHFYSITILCVVLRAIV